MWALLLVLGLVYYLATTAREHMAFNLGGPDYYNTEPGGPGYEVGALFPDTCRAREDGKTDLDAALCYKPCEAGYNGVGPVCWAITQSIGVGKPVGLEPCPAGWNNDGLICREPIQCGKGWDFFKKGCWGGRLQGRLNGGGICDWPSDRGNLPNWLVDKSDSKNYKATHPDKIDGMCYKKCPAHLPTHVPGMPYLCYKKPPLSYGRGVGVPPAPIALFGYTFG